MREMNFQSNIEKIYDHLYANHFSKTPSVIGEEVGKILHTGMFIEEQQGNKPAFNFNRIEAIALLNGDISNRKKFADSIQTSFVQMNKKWVLYGNKDKINLDDYDICYCCTQLSGIQISNKNRDLFGDAVEVFRAEWVKRMGGQFFTDQQVTKLAVNLLEFDPRKGDDLIDICAGTGGFLIAGLNRIQQLVNESEQIHEKEIIKLASKSLKGVEIDVDVCTVANSTLKTRLGIMGNNLIKRANSLDVDVFKNKDFLLHENSHRCAATNPPFGTKITIKDSKILSNFELAHRNQGLKKTVVPTAPDILFLEQNLKMLIPGKGKLAIVLPYQLLSGPQTYYIRKWLLRNSNIIAVIDLPLETFQPYTGTKTSLVVLERKKILDNDQKEIHDYNIFMSIPRWVGHDRRGNPIYDKNGTELLTDFNQVISAFDEFKKGKNSKNKHDLSFTVKYSSIINDDLLRINAKFWKPISDSQIKQNVNFKKSDWRMVKLKDLVKDIFYPGRFKRNYVDYSPGAIPFLGGSNINEFITTTNKWLSPDDPKLNDLKVRKGWILITRSGTTGLISSVPDAWDEYAMSEHVIRIVPDETKVPAEYLLAVLKSDYCQKILAKGIYGSVIDEINPDYIGNMDIPIPSSKKDYEPIIKMLNESEKYRQLGILNHLEAVDRINKLLSN